MSMKGTDEKTLAITWIALSAVTLAAWWLGSNSAGAPASNAAITYAVILMAGIKVRVIVSYFMEARHAPARLRRWLDGWLVVTIVVLLAIYSLRLSIPPV
jgi:hypothetical protein